MPTRPPSIPWTPDLCWVLGRAFGPADVPCEPPTDGDAAFELARELGIAARVAARTDGARLVAEAGPSAAEAFADARRRTAAREMALDALLRRILTVAREAGVPVVLLKHAALVRAGVLATGGRGAADVDLLAGREDAERLAEALCASGFTTAGGPPPAHHLAPLLDGRGGMVELHHRLPGLRTSRGEPAEVPALRAAGDLMADDEPGVLVPSRPLLIAHLLVHGLVQHGDAPHSYPLLRLAGDLLDLGWDRAETEDLEAVAAHGEALSEDDPETTHLLVARLAAADFDGLTGDTAEGRLLGHWLAGTLDPDYAAALRLRHLRPGLGEPSWQRHIWRTVWLSREQAVTLYGPLRRPWSLWALRLWRPFDLVGRAVKYGWAGWINRRRSRPERKPRADPARK